MYMVVINAAKSWWDTRALAGAKAAKLRENAMLLRGASSLYWPLGHDTGSKLWPYATACLEAALSISDIAAAIYAEIVEAWELPGCQELLCKSLERWPDTRVQQSKVIEAYCSKQTLPEMPGLLTTYERFKDSKDFYELNTRAAVFILASFNREINIVNETYKVIPGLHNAILKEAAEGNF